MEKIICAFINNTAYCYTHEILALNGCTDARDWIRNNKTGFVDFAKPDKRGRFFRVLHDALLRVQPDLLMTYNWGATDAIWLGRSAGIRYIVHTEHGFNVDEGIATNWKRDAVRFLLYRLASRIIVVSSELRKLMRRRYFIKERCIQRIPNGIDARHYSPDTLDRERMRGSLGFKEGHVVLGFSGRLDPIKNLDRLLEIFARCVRQYDNLRLLIVGDGPEEKGLKTFCQEHKLQDHVLFTGAQENVVPYLRAMDLFLLTSRREQMPMTVLEAMSVGLPVISTKVGDVANIVDHGVNGFVVDLQAPAETFVEFIHTLLCRERRESVGYAARQKIVSQFQEQIMVQRYKAVIEECYAPK